MATVHAMNGSNTRTIFVKGAPDRLLQLCKAQAMETGEGDGVGTPAALDLPFWTREQERLSAEGLRVLVLCKCDPSVENDPARV